MLHIYVVYEHWTSSLCNIYETMRARVEVGRERKTYSTRRMISILQTKRTKRMASSTAENHHHHHHSPLPFNTSKTMTTIFLLFWLGNDNIGNKWGSKSLESLQSTIGSPAYNMYVRSRRDLANDACSTTSVLFFLAVLAWCVLDCVYVWVYCLFLNSQSDCPSLCV